MLCDSVGVGFAGKTLRGAGKVKSGAQVRWLRGACPLGSCRGARLPSPVSHERDCGQFQHVEPVEGNVNMHASQKCSRDDQPEEEAEHGG